jgi:hypothetical protein
MARRIAVVPTVGRLLAMACHGDQPPSTIKAGKSLSHSAPDAMAVLSQYEQLTLAKAHGNKARAAMFLAVRRRTL